LSKKFVKPCLTWVAYLTLVTFDLMFLWILVCQHHSHVFGGSLRFNFLDDCFINSGTALLPCHVNKSWCVLIILRTCTTLSLSLSLSLSLYIYIYIYIYKMDLFVGKHTKSSLIFSFKYRVLFIYYIHPFFMVSKNDWWKFANYV
jgi:hypothetical protein